MTDFNKHKFLLLQILKDIYSDIELLTNLGFKGGTAQMLFYDLPRYSVDLDFNLINAEKSEIIYDKIKKIILKYGKIKDEAQKHFSNIVVLDYGTGERKLKIEISKRFFNDNYEIKNFLGISMLVMTKSDMFTHKLCALTDRNMLANRDIFDIYYFMKDRTLINKDLLEKRVKMKLQDYLEKCIKKVEKISDNKLLNGIGELIDEETKLLVRTKLKSEVLFLLKMYKDNPLV